MPDGTIPDLVTRSDALLLRAVREASREVDFVASTDAVDAYAEVIDQASWRLDRFKSNPVILYAHNSYSELPIGQATRCEVVNGQLEVTIKFATEDGNPRAEQVWQLVLQKVLRAVSVGFRPSDGKYELRDGKDVFVLYGCDLREVSVVALPANHECLAKMKAKALAARGPTAPDVTPCPEPSHEHAGRLVAGETCIYGKDGGRILLKQDGEVHLYTGSDTALSPTNPPAASVANPTPSKDDGQETDMINVKTILAMLSLTETATEAEVVDKVKALEKRATDAEVRASTTDTALAKVKALETDVTTLKSEKDVLTREHEKACTDRDTATKRADDAETKLIELEVDGLVGKKITPAEKADFVAMRKAMPDTFKSIVEKRPDMKLTEPVTTPDLKALPANGAPLAPAADAGNLFNTL